MRFLVDENLPGEVALVLRESGHDVLYVPGTDLQRSPDELLAAAAIMESRIIVTKDVRWALQASQSWPGVVFVRVPRWFNGRQIKQTIEFFISHPRFAEAEGRLTIVEPYRVIARRLPHA